MLGIIIIRAISISRSVPVHQRQTLRVWEADEDREGLLIGKMPQGVLGDVGLHLVGVGQVEQLVLPLQSHGH